MTVEEPDRGSDGNSGQRRSWHVRHAAIVLGGIALDQATKRWALSALDDGNVIEVLPTLEFDLFFNSGMSFSAAANAGRFIGVAVMIVSIVLLNLLRKEQSALRGALFATILSGAIGNLIDRVYRAEDGLLTGPVVDFIDVSWFAVFNVADIFVVCGAIALASVMFFTEEEPASAESSLETDETTPATE